MGTDVVPVNRKTNALPKAAELVSVAAEIGTQSDLILESVLLLIVTNILNSVKSSLKMTLAFPSCFQSHFHHAESLQSFPN